MIDDTLFEAEEKMDKAVTVAQEDFSKIRTGRVHPAIFSKITVEYYGSQTPLNQLASFNVPEPRTPASPSATSGGTPRTPSTRWRRTARPARTTSTAPSESCKT